VDDDPRYWFSEKSWWGARRAVTWEGWAFDIGACLALFATAPYVRQPTHPFQSLGTIFGLLALIVVVRHWKGEPGG